MAVCWSKCDLEKGMRWLRGYGGTGRMGSKNALHVLRHCEGNERT